MGHPNPVHTKDSPIPKTKTGEVAYTLEMGQAPTDVPVLIAFVRYLHALNLSPVSHLCYLICPYKHLSLLTVLLVTFITLK